MIFRKDINALRAISVIAVTIYHFSPDIMPSGFAGVDVFFVISGYLMCSIVLSNLDNNRFSLIDFYSRRAKRIIPSLIFLSICLMIFGFVYLNPIEYKTLAKHVISSLSFSSNYLYYLESGYFDTDAKTKWLLNTWSLSVEWQFYIIFPLFILFLNKITSRQKLIYWVTTATIISFFVSLYAAKTSTNLAYFGLTSRIWEMSLGCVAFLADIKISKIKRKVIAILGVIFILTSFFIYKPSTPWPSPYAIIPALGAILVLIANFDFRFYSSRIIDIIGKSSYSIYLWHWPILVGLTYYNVENKITIGLVTTLLISIFMYNIIEKKVSNQDAKATTLKATVAITILMIVSFLAYHTNGFINRLPEAEKKLLISASQATDDWEFPTSNYKFEDIKLRVINGNSDNNILIIGDSHIQQLYPFFKKWNSHYNIFFLTKGGCFVTAKKTGSGTNCNVLREYNKLLKSYQFEKIVTNFYCFTCDLPTNQSEKDVELQSRLFAYNSFVDDLLSHTKQVYLIKGEPKGKEFSPDWSIKNNGPSFIHESQVREHYIVHESAIMMIKRKNELNILDPIEYLCNKGVCKTRSENNEFYYKDSDHMRPWYVIEKASYLDNIIAN